MMKKWLSLLLALLLCLSLAACGGDSPSDSDGSAPPASEPVSEPENEPEDEPESEPDVSEPVDIVVTPYTDYDLLSQMTVYPAFSPEELDGTVWDFSGGYDNGQDLTEEEAATLLEMYGGTLQIEFIDTERANMVQGGGNMAGAYMILEDGITMNFAFEYEGQYLTYAAVFTSRSGEEGADKSEAVMVLVADADPTMALYMTPAG